MNYLPTKLRDIVDDETGFVDYEAISKAADLIEQQAVEIEALKTHIEELTVYEYREIGESGWMRCTKEWFEYCQKSPELDTRKRIKSLAEHDAEVARKAYEKGYLDGFNGGLEIDKKNFIETFDSFGAIDLGEQQKRHLAKLHGYRYTNQRYPSVKEGE